MSTAPAGNSSDPPQRTSHQPGPLAILTATAVGGVLATRMGKSSLVLAAGAAALALMNHKKAAPQLAQPLTPSALPPTPPPVEEPPPLEIPVQSQIEQWLSRQITREEQSPFIALSETSDIPSTAEDDYHPPSFLLDEAEESAHGAPSIDTFAGLTEPVLRQSMEPAPPTPEAEPEPEAAPEPEIISPPVFELPPFTPATIDSPWTLGVEPLPSLNEPAPFAATASNMFFFSAPVQQQQEPEPPPVFSAPVFEGAAFPDEIDVPPAAEPVAHLTPSPPPDVIPALEPEPVDAPQPPPTAEPAPEISVQLAAPGEASFDPPLADVPYNPWQSPEPDVPVAPHVPPVHSHTSSPVVEAEIILRPRAPMQNTVTSKSKFTPPNFSKHFPAENSTPPPADGGDDSQSSGPLPSPSEPRARTTWRSWWRGD